MATVFMQPRACDCKHGLSAVSHNVNRHHNVGLQREVQHSQHKSIGAPKVTISKDGLHARVPAGCSHFSDSGEWGVQRRLKRVDGLLQTAVAAGADGLGRVNLVIQAVSSNSD